MTITFSNVNLDKIIVRQPPFSYVDYEVTVSAASWDGLFPNYPNGGIGGCQLSDGNIAVAYYIYDGAYKIRLCVLDSSMAVIDTITSDAGPIPYYYPMPALLSNGNVGVGFTDDSDYYAWCAVFNITGSSMIQQPTLIDGNEWYDDSFEVTALVGGGFVISYLDGTTGGSIRENDGTERVASFTLRNPWRYNRMCALANGNFLIAYPTSTGGTYVIHNGTTGAVVQAELDYTDLGVGFSHGTCQPMKNPIDDSIQIWYTSEPGTDSERVYVTLLDAAGAIISKDNLIYAPDGIRIASGRAITLAGGSMMAPVYRVVTNSQMFELIQWDHDAMFKNGPIDLGFSQVSGSSRYYPILQFGDGKVVVFTNTDKKYSILSPV